MNNEVIELEISEYLQLKHELSERKDIFVVEIDGVEIQTWREYIEQIEEKFQFPRSCELNGNRYLDWMTDLDWLFKDEYAIVIKNFNEFLKNDISLRSRILKQYKEVILPFWQEEVEETVVDGKAKSFNVYLVR